VLSVRARAVNVLDQLAPLGPKHLQRRKTLWWEAISALKAKKRRE
jgi:hypothetical protein